MSEDWEGCFSDPFEPPIIETRLLEDELPKETEECGFKCFNCMGDVNVETIDIHPQGFLASGKEMSFLNDDLTCHAEKDDSRFISLFGRDWEKEPAFNNLHKHFFKMISKNLMILEEGALQDVSVLGDKAAWNRREQADFFLLRTYCVQVLQFFRDYIPIVRSRNKNGLEVKEKIEVFKHRLKILRKHLDQFRKYPDHVHVHSMSSNGNKSKDVCYHLVHAELDLRWLHLSCLWQLSKPLHQHPPPITHNFLFDQIQLLILELLEVSLKRFEKTDINYLRYKSPFTCSCIQELWMLITKIVDLLYLSNREKAFWDFISFYLDVDSLMKNEELDSSSRLRSYLNSNYSRFFIFSFWIVYHVSRVYRHISKEDSYNYVLLESNLKQLLSGDVSESTLRVCLFFIEKIYLDIWEPRAELLLILWEYFHKKINNSFYLSGGPPSSLAVISKTPVGLLNQLNFFLNDIDSVTNSFQHFLRIIGIHLRKVKTVPRHWKLLKGRMYSKLTLAKLETLSNVGEYHFVSLFLMLAISQDISEAGMKLVELISDYFKKRKWLSDELTKGMLSVGVLLIENDEDASQALQPVSTFLSQITIYEQPRLMRIYLETFNHIFTLNKPLSLGHHLLIGKWISDYLSSSSRCDTARLLDTLITVLNKLKVYSDFSLPEQNVILMIEKLWDELKNYLECIVGEQEIPYQISDIAATLAAIFLQQSNTQRFIDIVNMFVNRNMSDVSVLRQFVCNISENEAVKDLLPNYDQVILKTWLKCFFTCPDVEHSDMKQLTKIMVYSTIATTLFIEPPQTLLVSRKPFYDFCSLLHSKYILEDMWRKHSMRENFQGYLEGIEKWVKPLITPPKDSARIHSLYLNAATIVRYTSPLLYMKSRPNSVLQKLIDTLLLPMSARNPEVKLNPHILSAVKASLHFFIEGLLFLDPGSDPYIGRVVKELVVVYIPHCMNTQNQTVLNCSSFLLISYFSTFDCSSRKFLFDIIMNSFFKRKSKNAHPSALFALKFVKELISTHRNKEEMLTSVVTGLLDHVCNVLMYSEDTSPINNAAKDILKLILNSDVLRANQTSMEKLMEVLKGLCEEQLAWSSRQLFDLLVFMTQDAPDIIRRFTPVLLHQVQLVEAKRGVTYDRTLRLGIERVEMNLRAIKDAV